MTSRGCVPSITALVPRVLCLVGAVTAAFSCLGPKEDNNGKCNIFSWALIASIRWTIGRYSPIEIPGALAVGRQTNAVNKYGVQMGSVTRSNFLLLQLVSLGKHTRTSKYFSLTWLTHLVEITRKERKD